MILSSENDVIKSIVEFLYSSQESNTIDTFTLYNQWVDTSNVVIARTDLVDMAISFMRDAKSLDKSLLAESYNVDFAC